jgi:hypothetical protein
MDYGMKGANIVYSRIQPFTLAPWETRVKATLSTQGEEEENKIKELAKAG